MKTIIKNRRGNILILFGLLLIVIIGIAALATDVGRWYTVRSELSKSVDAAGLAGAKTIGQTLNQGTYLTLAEDFGYANFPDNLLTQKTGQEKGLTFTATEDGANHSVTVTGSVGALGTLSRIFVGDMISASNNATAKKNKVEIMLVLDRSGSMSGTKIRDLKTAAKSFVTFFEDTQDTDKMGLVSFATTSRVDLALGTNYVTAINNKITAMSADGATITEDAVEQAGEQLSDQSGLNADQRIQQYVIFFSDGMPTALRDSFKYNNTDYDGVAVGQGSSGHANCRTSDYSYMSVVSALYKPSSGTYSGVDPSITGDGKSTATTSCRKCTRYDRRNNCIAWANYSNTKWYIFEADRLGPVSGYSAESCSIPTNKLIPYFCNAARQLALNNAQTLKDRYIKIFVIGLGNTGSGGDIDEDFLTSISSGAEYTFIAPDSSDLQAIFNQIAKEIKLRLVQ